MNSLSISIIQETIGLLAARDEIDNTIASNIDQMLREGCLIEGVQTSALSGIVLRNLTREFTPPTHSESLENVRGPSLPGPSVAPPATPRPATASTPATTAASHPIASLRIAKGWEEKLAALGVTTIAELEQFVRDGKLAPGFAPRIGPDAVEKIKAALAKAGGVIVEANAKPLAPAIAPPQKTLDQIRAEGAEFARLGYKSSENPYTRGTSDWHQWDHGWQEWFATHDADDEATLEDVPTVPESTPDVPAEDFPEMDLAATATATAIPQTELLDTSDL